jgi:DNA-binding response OmpR family regulator
MNNRILVLDDEESMRSLLRRALEYEGYEVYEASRTEPAFELFKEVKPFLNLCDLRLADHVDGATYAGMAKKHDCMVINICVTGELSSFDKGYLLATGTFTDILLKPVDMKLLLGVVQYASDKYERWGSY